VDLDVFALPHIAHPLKAEPGEHLVDRLALRVEDARFQGNPDVGLHHPILWRESRCALTPVKNSRRDYATRGAQFGLELTSTGPLPLGRGFSVNTPRRRATS